MGEAVLTSIHNLCFEQKYEKYQNFCLKKIHILVANISIYLHRRVFVMFRSSCIAIGCLKKFHPALIQPKEYNNSISSQRNSRSYCASAQSDLDLRCPLAAKTSLVDRALSI